MNDAIRELAEPRKSSENLDTGVEGELIAKLGHELRTPLTAILGYTEILKIQAQNHLPPEQLHYLSVIQRSGQAMLRLITAVIDWARLESGHLEPDPSEFAVTETFRSFADTMLILSSAKGLNFSLSFAPRCRSHFVSDPHLLRQIFTNLVTNGIKYTERGSVTVLVECDDKELLFTVSDTGPGIPPSEHHRVFQEFQRLTPGAAKEGTGLGLAITRGLVELLGGTIRLQSRLGEGCRFEVRLPRLVEVRRQEEPLPLPFPTVRRYASVLVVDDEPDNRQLLKHYLESEGMNVRVLSDGRDCLAEALRKTPDVILMDMMMPDVDGYEATRRLRSFEGTRTIPIIGLTAMAGPATAEKALAAGCNHCLTKPLDFRKLYHTIQQCLNSSSAARQ